MKKLLLLIFLIFASNSFAAYQPKYIERSGSILTVLENRSMVFTNAGTPNATIDPGSVSYFLSGIDVSQLSIASGTPVNEISTDGTLSSDLDTALVTEKAIKAYVDASSGTVSSLNDIGDVAITGTPSVGDVVTWSGSAWINATPSASGGTSIGSQTYFISEPGNTMSSLSGEIQYSGSATISEDLTGTRLFTANHTSDPSIWTANVAINVVVTWTAQMASTGNAITIYKNGVQYGLDTQIYTGTAQGENVKTIPLAVNDTISVGSSSGSVHSGAGINTVTIMAYPK